MAIKDRCKKCVGEVIRQTPDYSEVILAVYLFGSVSDESYRDTSDIDLAFVFEDLFYKKDPFEALRIAETIGTGISKEMGKAVDVSVLNSASVIFNHEILHKGICIYEKDPGKRILYEVLIDNKYEDHAPFIEELRISKRRTLIGRD